MIRFVYKDKVEISNAFKHIYGFKVLSGTDKKIFVNPDDLARIINKTKTSTKFSNFVFVVIKKSKVKNYPDDFKTAFKTEVFYLFYDKNLMTLFKQIVPTAVEMTGEEIAQSIFSSQVLLDDYYIEQKRLVLKNLPSFSQDNILSPPPGKTYRTFLDNYLEKKKAEGLYPFFIYKAFKPLTKNPDTENLFSTEWTGALWLTFNLNRIDSIIRSRANSVLSPAEAKKWKDFADAYRAGEELVAGVEAVLITEEEDVEIVSSVFRSIGCDYVCWELFYEKTIKESPLNVRDDDFMIIAYPEFLARLMPISFAKNYSVIMKDTVYGRNKDGEYITYAQFKEGQSPHMSIIAPTRSGKSYFIQNFITVMANIDCKKLYDGTIESNTLPIEVRYFDVGFSAEFLVKLLQARGFSVAVMNPKPDIKINLIEMDNPVEELDIAVNLINIVLETKKEEVLTAREEGLFRKIVYTLYKKPELKQNNYVEWLKDKYPYYYQKAIELGYKDGDLFSSLKEEEFTPLHYPVLSDVIRLARQVENESSLEEERKTAHSLIVKLSIVRSIENFFAYSDINIKNKRFVYIDLNYFKKSPNFVPIYSAILTRVVKSLQKVKNADEVKLFVCDEFHNVVKVKVFKDFFEVLAREAAKYNIYLVLISQEPTDIPKEIINAMGTKVFLKPAGEVEGESSTFSFEESVKEHFSVRDDVMEEFRLLPKYTPLFLYANGYFTLQLPLTKEKMQIFESRTILELKTPDGIVIKKTYVTED